MLRTVLPVLVICGLGACRSAGDDRSPEAGGRQAASYVLDDVTNDPELSYAELAAAAPMVVDDEADSPFAYLVATYDADGDGRVTGAEYTRNAEQFAKWDADADGALTAEDFASAPGRVPGDPRPKRAPLALEGRRAPDFTLSSPDGGETVTLSSFAGDRPVALIFGSYT